MGSQETEEERAGRERDEKYRRGGKQRVGVGGEKGEGDEKKSYSKEGAVTVDWKGRRKVVFSESASQQPLLL